jgi:hydrophobic/amphiphilic exporter-1 (mainly G- bacteria), HAE1 family
MNLYRTAVERPVATAMLFVGILVLGWFAFSRLAVDLFPEIDAPALSVITTWQGSGALEIERNVTEPLEDMLATVPNLDRITSNSIDNVSMVTLEFDWGTNMDEAASDVRDALGRASRLLPDGSDEPIIHKFSAGAIPVVIYSATAGDSYPELEQIIEDQIAGPLNRLGGVGTVSITGAPRMQVDVVLDRERFEAYALDIGQISQSLQSENVTSPAGRLDYGRDSYNLRVNTQFASIDDIANVIVANHNGRVVRLHEIARVTEGFADETAISRVNGRQGVTFAVQKQTGANRFTVGLRSTLRTQPKRYYPVRELTQHRLARPCVPYSCARSPARCPCQSMRRRRVSAQRRRRCVRGILARSQCHCLGSTGVPIHLGASSISALRA